MKSRHGVRHSDDQLLDGARTAFLRHGYHATSMDEIAATAGSSKPTLYNRFNDKEQVYRRAVRRETEDLGEVLATARSIFGGHPPRIRVRAAITAFFDWAGVEPAGFELLFGDFATEIAWEERNAFLTQIRGRMVEGIRDTVRERSRLEVGESAEVIASMCISLVVGGAHRAGQTKDGLDGAAEVIMSFTEEALVNLNPETLATNGTPR